MNHVTDKAAPPAWPFPAVATFAIIAASIVLGIALFGQTEGREFLGYVLLLIIGPFAGGWLWARRERAGAATRPQAAEHIVVLAAGTLLLLCLAAFLQQNRGIIPFSVSVPILLGGFLLFCLATLVDRLPMAIEHGLGRLTPYAAPLLLASLLAFCAVYAPLYPDKPLLPVIRSWFAGDPLFLVLLVAAWPIGYFLPRLPRLRGGPLAWALLLVLLLLVLLLYDDGHFIEYVHYVPYVGPALHARHGGIPMVDVYSQYGLLPWALLSFAYHWLPETFGSAAVVVRLVTLVWFVVFVLTAYRLVEDKAVGMILAAMGLIWAVTFHVNVFNLNGLPSTQGYRYLLPQLTILYLAVARRDRSLTLGLALLTAAASLTSLEAIVLTAGPIGALASMTAVRDRSARPLLRDVLAMLVGVAAAQTLLTLVLLTAYHRLPDYRPYFELVGNFEPGAPSHWNLPMLPGFGLWVPFAVILFGVLAMAAHDAIAGRRDHPRAWFLVPAAVLAIGEARYYVGRSSPTALGLALLPFLLVIFVGVDALLQRWRMRPTRELRWERLVIGLAVATIFAFSAERFARPYNPGKGNSTILRHCFTAAGCAPSTVLARITAAINEQPSKLREDAPKNYVFAGLHLPEHLSEILALAPKNSANGRLGLLVDTSHLPYLGVLALAELDEWYPWPISSPDNDGQSASLRRIILASALPARDGLRLIVDKKRNILTVIERQLLKQYQRRCTLQPTGETRFYDVLQTSDCKN